MNITLLKYLENIIIMVRPCGNHCFTAVSLSAFTTFVTLIFLLCNACTGLLLIRDCYFKKIIDLIVQRGDLHSL